MGQCKIHNRIYDQRSTGQKGSEHKDAKQYWGYYLPVPSCSVDEEGYHQISLSKLFKDIMKIMLGEPVIIRKNLNIQLVFDIL